MPITWTIFGLQNPGDRVAQWSPGSPFWSRLPCATPMAISMAQGEGRDLHENYRRAMQQERPESITRNLSFRIPEQHNSIATVCIVQ